MPSKTETTFDPQRLANEIEVARYFYEEKDDPTRYVGWEKLVEHLPHLADEWNRLQRDIEMANKRFRDILDYEEKRTGCRHDNG